MCGGLQFNSLEGPDCLTDKVLGLAWVCEGVVRVSHFFLGPTFGAFLGPFLSLVESSFYVTFDDEVSPTTPEKKTSFWKQSIL